MASEFPPHSNELSKSTGNMDSHQRTEQESLDLLFSKTTGAGFTILCNGIGSANFSALDYVDYVDYVNSIQPLSPGSPAAAPFYNWNGSDSGQL
jgi:hypothetical protein